MVELALDLGDQTYELKRYANGSNSTVGTRNVTFSAGEWVELTIPQRSRSHEDRPDYDFADGMPSGRVGVITNVASTRFDTIESYTTGRRLDLGGRWESGLAGHPGGWPRVGRRRGASRG